MCAFLPGSDSNLSHELNLNPSLSCLDLSLRLGQSGECWQGVSLLALQQTSSRLEAQCTQPLELYGKLYQQKKKKKRKTSSEIVLWPHSGQAGLKPKPSPSFFPPFIISASCLLPILPKQRGRLCSWMLSKGDIFGVSYQHFESQAYIWQMVYIHSTCMHAC